MHSNSPSMDPEAFLLRVEQAITTVAPESYRVLRKDRHCWIIEVPSRPGSVLDYDYVVIASTAPEHVVVLHGNGDGGPAMGLPWSGTYLGPGEITQLGLEASLRRIFTHPPNRRNLS